jgi:archaellum biogenesis ATPase FlaH
LATFNVEKAFVSKVIQDGLMTKEIAETPTWFIQDPDYRSAFEYIIKYYSDIGSVPTLRVFKADCPKIVVVPVEEPWADLHKRLTNQYIRAVLDENLDKYNAAMDANEVETAINFLGATLSKVHTAIPHSRDVDVTENSEERLARYQERRDNPGTLVGVPSGFPTIDRATQGFQPGQLVTITGLAKASKSTLAMAISMAIQEYGKRVLYITFEQTVEEQERRLDAYRAGFNDNKLNSGEITDEEWAALQEGVHRTEALPPMMISEDCNTVTAIGAKADSFQPDVIVIDGVYIMDDEEGQDRGSSFALANIISGLKKLAMRRLICIIAVTQSTPARTKGETLNNDSIMGSRAFVQYSNVVIGIERTDDVGMRKMKILLSRSCAPCEIVLLFNYDTAEFKELEGFSLDDEIDMELANEEGFSSLY